jgi:hypothetical protein
MTLLYAVSGLTALIFVVLFIWKAARGGPLPHKMVAVALLLDTLVGMRDLYVFRLSQVYGGNTYLRYSSVLFGLTLGYIVVMRFRAVSGQARDLTANLAARVAQKSMSWRRVTSAWINAPASRSARPSAHASCATCTMAWVRTSARPSASWSPGVQARARCCRPCVSLAAPWWKSCWIDAGDHLFQSTPSCV